jgi:ectoine hydroxylase-related dioxygenase (phytanoyl-CoA dioxygenase family)
VHFDDAFYPFPRPRPAISISVIGAIDAFTPQNGGTVLYRGSHRWSSERIQAQREAVARDEAGADAECRLQLAMPPGAIWVFQGTLLHGGGANRSNAPRLAFTNQYCEPWARPQENFYLGVPKEKVRAMSREMQILLGYELRRRGDIMRQVGGYHPMKTLDPDFVLPVLRWGAGTIEPLAMTSIRRKLILYTRPRAQQAAKSKLFSIRPRRPERLERSAAMG